MPSLDLFLFERTPTLTQRFEIFANLEVDCFEGNTYLSIEATTDWFLIKMGLPTTSPAYPVGVFSRTIVRYPVGVMVLCFIVSAGESKSRQQ